MPGTISMRFSACTYPIACLQPAFRPQTAARKANAINLCLKIQYMYIVMDEKHTRQVPGTISMRFSACTYPIACLQPAFRPHTAACKANAINLCLKIQLSCTYVRVLYIHVCECVLYVICVCVYTKNMHTSPPVN